jgi:hypothetical protein
VGTESKTDLLIIIQNHKQSSIEKTSMIHGLISHASSYGTVTNNSNAMVGFLLHALPEISASPPSTELDARRNQKKAILT